jgi:hypothetical protein
MTDSEHDHERVAAGLARLAEPPPPAIGAATLAYLGLNPDDVEVRALVMLCLRYRLDPLLGHASIIKAKGGNRAYITRDGMLEVAHRSGQLDGIVVDEERESEHGWSATVSVHRRDMAHPFTYRGGCGVDEPQAEQGHGAEMALARAERRALKRAFNISAFDDADDPVLDPAVLDPADHHLADHRRDGVLVCACGELFNTVWSHSVHRKQQAPGPAAPAPAMPRPADPGPKPRARREPGPPPDYYDNLPEAQGRG